MTTQAEFKCKHLLEGAITATTQDVVAYAEYRMNKVKLNERPLCFFCWRNDQRETKRKAALSEYPYICKHCGHTIRYTDNGLLTDGQWVTCENNPGYGPHEIDEVKKND